MLYLRQSRYSALFFFNCKCGLNPYRLCCLYFSVMMRSFQDLARKNLSEKFQGYRMLGMLALKQVKRFFEISDPDEHIIAEEKITGYLRYSTLFIKTSDQKLKIEIFKQKKKLIESINQHFLSLGYQHRLTDLRLK